MTTDNLPGMIFRLVAVCLVAAVLCPSTAVEAQDDWEVTAAGEASLESGLEWPGRCI